MKKIIIVFAVFVSTIATAQSIDSMQIFLDSIESKMNYQHGKITFENGIGTLDIPSGFRYLDGEQTSFVLTGLWGNPDGSGTLGMIVPEEIPITSPDSWAFIITYDEMGFVKDDDADDIDYDDLLTEMQSDTEAENELRMKEGFEAIALVGWASKPFYDNEKKVLHWAKEIKFGDAEENTLNYNVRILGRKGVLVFNAVSAMSALPDVQKNIEPVLASFHYADGNKYSDFNPELDEVAAWTIGGLVAGKVLAKVGILAFLLKYIKLIGIALVAGGTAAWKWFKRRTEPPTVRNITDNSNPA